MPLNAEKTTHISAKGKFIPQLAQPRSLFQLRWQTSSENQTKITNEPPLLAAFFKLITASASAPLLLNKSKSSFAAIDHQAQMSAHVGTEATSSESHSNLAIDPSLDLVRSTAKKALGLTLEENAEVQVYADSHLEGVYHVSTQGGTYRLCLSASICDTADKIRSEVATASWVAEATTIQVPTPVAHNAGKTDDLESGWILMLMSSISGAPLINQWREMSMIKKEKLVQEVAAHQAQLLQPRNRFHNIGSLYQQETVVEKRSPSPCGGAAKIPFACLFCKLVSLFTGLLKKMSPFAAKKASTENTSVKSFIVDHMVSAPFIFDEVINKKGPRGPFKSSYDWLHALITLEMQKQDRELVRLADDNSSRGHMEICQAIKQTAERLLAVLPLVFPLATLDDGGEVPEETVLVHPELNMASLLVDVDGNLTGVMDWECASTLPLWKAMQYPKFLSGRPREEKPHRDGYDNLDTDLDDDDFALPDSDDETRSEVYWGRVLEYEQTHLRRIYAAEMEKQYSGWEQMMQDYHLMADFGAAVDNLGAWSLRTTNRWLDEIEMGKESRYWNHHYNPHLPQQAYEQDDQATGSAGNADESEAGPEPDAGVLNTSSEESSGSSDVSGGVFIGDIIDDEPLSPCGPGNFYDADDESASGEDY